MVSNFQQCTILLMSCLLGSFVVYIAMVEAEFGRGENENIKRFPQAVATDAVPPPLEPGSMDYVDVQPKSFSAENEALLERLLKGYGPGATKSGGGGDEHGRATSRQGGGLAKKPKAAQAANTLLGDASTSVHRRKSNGGKNTPPCDASRYGQDHEPLPERRMQLDPSTACQARQASCIPSDRWHWARGKSVLANSNKGRTYCGAMCGIGLCCPGASFAADDLLVITPGTQAPVGVEAEVEITLVTAGSFSRLEAVRTTLQRWRGPVVIVFHIRNATKDEHADAGKALESVKREFRGARENIKVVCYVTKPRGPGDQKKITGLQAAIDDDPTYTEQQRRAVDDIEELSARYPINTMRNVAMDQAATNWVLNVDMDLVPSETLYDSLKTNHLIQAASIYLPALVVPHFEILQCKREQEIHIAGGDDLYTVPKGMADLVGQLRVARARPFHLWGHNTPSFFDHFEAGLRSWGMSRHLGRMDCGNDDKEYVEGHGKNLKGIRRTEYKTWISQSMFNFSGLYAVSTVGKGGPFPVSSYEPFVAVRRVEANGRLTPRFSEYFVGRDMNKVSWVAQLYRRNFHFFVVLQDFLIHYPHGKSKGDHKKRGSSNEKHAVVTAEYVAEMEEKLLHNHLVDKNQEQLWHLPSAADRRTMSAVRLWCPTVDQDLPTPFVRKTSLCPEASPFLDRAHTFFVKQGDVCRADPRLDSILCRVQPRLCTWECPDGYTKSTGAPFCVPEPGSAAFPEEIEGAKGNLRPCRVPKALVPWI